MRQLVLLLVDAGLSVPATFCALLLRENFELSAVGLTAFLPYLMAIGAAGLAVFSLAGLNRSLWRFSSLPDHLRVAGALAAVIVAAGLRYLRVLDA